jgi:DNA-binding transcriptional regulator WhiA
VTSQKVIDTEPEFTPELAEIVGIMFGDGNMRRYNSSYVVRIFMNAKKDNQYANYVRFLFRKNFGVALKSHVDETKNSLALYYYSKKLTEVFNQRLLIPFSPKKLDCIPAYIKENAVLLKSFIRGLFDTDGCIIYQRDVRKKRVYVYALVKISTKFLPFAEDIKRSLMTLGIPAFICTKKNKHECEGFDVMVRHKNAIMFFNKIGSRNSRNIKKWGCWDSDPNLVVPSSKRRFDAPMC